MYGDAVFDATRTFGGRPFKLDAHLARLRRSLRYIELNAERIIPEVREAVDKVIAQSTTEIEALGDVLVFAYVTRGVASEAMLAPGDEPAPTVIVLLRPINFAAFADLYDTDGVDLSLSLTVRHFQGAGDPRVKSTNRLAAVRGELKGLRMAQIDGRSPSDTRAWTVVFSDDGSIAEAHGANLCIVSEGTLVRPPRYEALGGISLATVCELAQSIGLETVERRINLYDIINADETLICASSFQLLPVAAIDGILLSSQREVYSRLLRLWIDLVGVDFVAQAKEKAAVTLHPEHISV